MVTGWWRSKTRTSSCIFQKNSGGVIRFKSKDIPENTVIPKGGIFNDWNYPFTSHGFTAEIKEIIEVPEFTQKKINSRSIQKQRFEIPKAEFFKRNSLILHLPVDSTGRGDEKGKQEKKALFLVCCLQLA